MANAFGPILRGPKSARVGGPNELSAPAQGLDLGRGHEPGLPRDELEGMDRENRTGPSRPFSMKGRSNVSHDDREDQDDS